MRGKTPWTKQASNRIIIMSTSIAFCLEEKKWRRARVQQMPGCLLQDCLGQHVEVSLVYFFSFSPMSKERFFINDFTIVLSALRTAKLLIQNYHQSSQGVFHTLGPKIFGVDIRFFRRIGMTNVK